jgi:hypothetical protein
MAEGIIAGDVFDSDAYYSSCDLYLAAFFISAGCKMIKSTRDATSKRVYFHFEKTPILIDLKVSYFSRQAKIDAITFADNVKSLKSLCHNLGVSKKQVA